MRFEATCAMAFFVASCGSASTPSTRSFPDAPLATITSEQNQLVVEVRTAPEQPPERGVATVQLVVKNGAGALQEGLAIDMQPWMPSMGHGAAARPTLSVDGPGTYVLDNVQLYMAGRWELRTSFSGSVTDRATPAFD